MRIERIAIRLRQRSPQEAIDLGGAMLRAWGGDVVRVWFSTYWVFALLLLAVCWHYQNVAAILLWWLKPLFERILLFTYGRALFGERTRVRDAFAALPDILRNSGLLSGLTLRRLSMARSFLLPVWQLERLHGKAARERFRLLSRRGRGTAVWLTIVCVHVSSMLWFASLLLVELLIPREGMELSGLMDWFAEDVPPWRLFIANLFFLVAETIVEPLYVASGFSLYLNRRSDLEGWDIELAFRRLATRVARPAAVLLCAVGLALSWPPGAALAAEPPTAVAHRDVAMSEEKRTIEQILADPVFGQTIRERKWRIRDAERTVREGAERPQWPYSLAGFFGLLSEALKGLVWILGGLLLVAFIYLLAIHRERLTRGNSRPPPPDFLFGLDVRPESLPDDPVAAARAALAAGRADQALGLLYRAALVALIHSRNVEFRPGDTEGDCRARISGRVEAATANYFDALIDAWQDTAYAHRPPPADRLEALCAGWETHFRGTFGAPRT